MLTVFKQTPEHSVSLRIIFFPCYIFPWVLRNRKKKGNLQNYWNIWSFWEMDEMFLNFKCIHDCWKCCETIMFLYSFSSFTFIHQYVCCTHSSGKLRLKKSHRTQIAKLIAKILELLNTSIIILCEWTVQWLTTQALDWTAWIKMSMGMLLISVSQCTHR